VRGLVDAEPWRNWRRLLRSVKQQPYATDRSTGDLGMARMNRHADPAGDGGLDSESINCRVEGRGADEVVVSVDPPGHYNPAASQGPLGRIVSWNFLPSFPSRGGLDRKVHYGWKTTGPLAGYKSFCFIDERRRSRLNSCLKPYWGKPAVRNFRGGGENTGISLGVLCVPSLLGDPIPPTRRPGSCRVPIRVFILRSDFICDPQRPFLPSCLPHPD
jgi:hypothetical protein